MSFDFNHKLKDIIDPEALKYLVNLMKDMCPGDDFLNAPFIHVEYKGLKPDIIFWKPKDVFDPEHGAVDHGISYCEYFLRMCGRHKNAALFPYLVAEMVKNGKLTELEVVFLEHIAMLAVIGLATYNLACWGYGIYGDTSQPDFSWMTDSSK